MKGTKLMPLVFAVILNGCLSHHYRYAGSAMWKNFPETGITGRGFLQMKLRGSYQFTFNEDGTWDIVNLGNMLRWSKITVVPVGQEPDVDNEDKSGQTFIWSDLELPSVVFVEGDFTVMYGGETLGIWKRSIEGPCGWKECDSLLDNEGEGDY